jgi:hypothetical protein
MEIGTWIGVSTYSMAQASDALIYTCDQGSDNFFMADAEDSYTNRIIRHPDTHSSEFLKKMNGGFDFVFVDGWLTDTDVKDIFAKCEDKFTFITHDYYRSEEPKPVFCKGRYAVKRMITYAWEIGYGTELFPTDPAWLPHGYHLEGFGGINACCAMLKFDKRRTIC